MNNEEKILMLLEQLTQGQTEMRSDIESLKQGQAEIKADVTQIKNQVDVLYGWVDGIDISVKDLKKTK